MAFNYASAKKAGYSDQEINDYLKQGQQKAPWLNNVLQLGGAVGGGVLGGAGGAVAGAAVPLANLTGASELAGGYLGGVAGAGAGAGVGNAGADWIRKTLLGDKTVDMNQTVPNSVEAGKEGAIGQAIGGPLAKGLGIAAHPIASVMSGAVPFIKGVDATLAKSSKQIDIGELLGLYRKNVIPEMQKQGVGSDATQAFNKLSADMAGATSAYKAGPKLMDTEAMGMNLPIAQANQLKRDVAKSVSNFYGQATQNADINTRKAFGGLLKDAIQTAEPGVKWANNTASALYKVPEVTQGLAQILALGNPKAAKAIDMLGNIPRKMVQTPIPKGGGYLNQTLPILIQMLQQTNRSQQN